MSVSSSTSLTRTALTANQLSLLIKNAADLHDPTPLDSTHVYEQLLANYPAKSIKWVKDIPWIGPVEIPLDRIDWDSEKSWAAYHQEAHVDHFTAQLRARNDDINPVIGVQVPGDERVKIVDGHHRALAYKKLGRRVKMYVGFAPTGKPSDPWFQAHLYQEHQGSSSLNKSSGKQANFILIQARDSDSKRRYLLQYRADDATWSLPGGNGCAGETPWETAEREAREELGSLPDIQPAAQWNVSENSDGDQRVIFLARALELFHPASDNSDGEMLGWAWVKRKQVSHMKLNPLLKELWDELDFDDELLGGTPVSQAVEKNFTAGSLGTGDVSGLAPYDLLGPEADDEDGKFTLNTHTGKVHVRLSDLAKRFNPSEARDKHGEWAHNVSDSAAGNIESGTSQHVTITRSTNPVIIPVSDAHNIELHMDGVDPLLQKIITARMKLFASRYPYAAGKLQSVSLESAHTFTTQIASTHHLGNSQTRVYLNTKFFSDFRVLQASMSNALKSGFHPLDTMGSVIDHEMGHVIDFAHYDDNDKMTLPSNGDGWKDLLRNLRVSKYAGKNRQEAFAESFAVWEDHETGTSATLPFSKLHPVMKTQLSELQTWDELYGETRKHWKLPLELNTGETCEGYMPPEFTSTPAAEKSAWYRNISGLSPHDLLGPVTDAEDDEGTLAVELPSGRVRVRLNDLVKRFNPEEPRGTHGEWESALGQLASAVLSPSSAVTQRTQHESVTSQESRPEYPVNEIGPLYHGTTAERANDILARGFSQEHAAQRGIIFLTRDKKLAHDYAKARVKADGGGKPVILHIGSVRGVSAEHTGYSSPELNRGAGADYIEAGPAEVKVLNPAAIHDISLNNQVQKSWHFNPAEMRNERGEWSHSNITSTLEKPVSTVPEVSTESSRAVTQIPAGSAGHVVKLHIDSVDPVFQDAVIERVKNFAARYPNAASTLSSVTAVPANALKSNVMASTVYDKATGTSSIKLNLKYFSDMNVLMKSAIGNYNAGYHPLDTPESVIDHELGHVLDNAYYVSDTGMPSQEPTWDWQDDNAKISGYAAKSRREAFAEAFSAWENSQSATPAVMSSAAVKRLSRDMADDLGKLQQWDLQDLRAHKTARKVPLTSERELAGPTCEGYVLPEFVPPSSTSKSWWQNVSILRAPLQDFAAKVGPEGYIHGFICVRPPCGPKYKETVLDKKKGLVLDGDGNKIGRVPSKDADGKYSAVHFSTGTDGSEVREKLPARFNTPKEAFAAIPVYHNVKAMRDDADSSETRAALEQARQAVASGDMAGAARHLELARQEAGNNGDHAMAAHIEHVHSALTGGEAVAPSAVSDVTPVTGKPRVANIRQVNGKRVGTMSLASIGQLRARDADAENVEDWRRDYRARQSLHGASAVYRDLDASVRDSGQDYALRVDNLDNPKILIDGHHRYASAVSAGFSNMEVTDAVHKVPLSSATTAAPVVKPSVAEPQAKLPEHAAKPFGEDLPRAAPAPVVMTLELRAGIQQFTGYIEHGSTVSPENAKAAFESAVNAAPVGAPELHRGLVDSERTSSFRNSQPGDIIDLPVITSWSDNPEVADNNSYGDGVILHATPGMRALDIHAESQLPNEREWAAAPAKLEVMSRRDDPKTGQTHVTVRPVQGQVRMTAGELAQAQAQKPEAPTDGESVEPSTDVAKPSTAQATGDAQPVGTHYTAHSDQHELSNWLNAAAADELRSLVRDPQLQFRGDDGMRKSNRLEALKKDAVSGLLQRGYSLPVSVADAVAGKTRVASGRGFKTVPDIMAEWAGTGGNADAISKRYTAAVSADKPEIVASDWKRVSTGAGGVQEKFADAGSDAAKRRADVAKYYGVRAQQAYTQAVLRAVRGDDSPISITRLVTGKYADDISSKSRTGAPWTASSRVLSSWAEPSDEVRDSIRDLVGTGSSDDTGRIWLSSKIPQDQVFASYHGEPMLRATLARGEIVPVHASGKLSSDHVSVSAEPASNSRSTDSTAQQHINVPSKIPERAVSQRVISHKELDIPRIKADLAQLAEEGKNIPDIPSYYSPMNSVRNLVNGLNRTDPKWRTPDSVFYPSDTRFGGEHLPPQAPSKIEWDIGNIDRMLSEGSYSHGPGNELTRAATAKLRELRGRLAAVSDEIKAADTTSPFAPGEFTAGTKAALSGTADDHLKPEDLSEWSELIGDNRLSYPEDSGKPQRLSALKSRLIQSALRQAGLPENAAYVISGGEDDLGNWKPNGEGVSKMLSAWSVTGGDNAIDASNKYEKSMKLPAPPEIRTTDFAGAYYKSTPLTGGSVGGMQYSDMSPEATARRKAAIEYWVPRAQQHYTNQVLREIKKDKKPLKVTRYVFGHYADQIHNADQAGRAWTASTRPLSSWADGSKGSASAKKYVLGQSSEGARVVKLTQSIPPESVFYHWRGESTLRNYVKALGEIVVHDAQLSNENTAVEDVPNPVTQTRW